MISLSKGTYTATVQISRRMADIIEKYLTADSEEDYQSEDETICHTAVFPDGKEMDIKCCGAQDDASWTEAVLFNANGAELCCTEVYCEYLGEWMLEYDGITYVANVEVEQTA